MNIAMEIWDALYSKDKSWEGSDTVYKGRGAFLYENGTHIVIIQSK